jgi:hypothetical protein
MRPLKAAISTKGKAKTGRPPKFHGPSRPVTMTLPESVLDRLASIDSDRARAIVMLTEAALPDEQEREKQIEIAEVMPGLGVIIVAPSRLLPNIKWLRLVRVSPTRYLLAIPSGTPIESLELAILDLLEEAHEPREKALVNQLRDLIRLLRRQDGLFKAEMLFIDMRRIDEAQL